MAQGRDPAASTAQLRSMLYDSHHGEGLSAFATFLFTHNAQVSILEFALGFAFALPTAIFDAYEGLTLGALMALYASRGMGVELGAWLSIHGATELFAGILSGAAGFHIGWAMAFPGDRPRLEAAAAAGRSAAAVMAGVGGLAVFFWPSAGVGPSITRGGWGG